MRNHVLNVCLHAVFDGEHQPMTKLPLPISDALFLHKLPEFINMMSLAVSKSNENCVHMYLLVLTWTCVSRCLALDMSSDKSAASMAEVNVGCSPCLIWGGRSSDRKSVTESSHRRESEAACA